MGPMVNPYNTPYINKLQKPKGPYARTRQDAFLVLVLQSFGDLLQTRHARALGLGFRVIVEGYRFSQPSSPSHTNLPDI